MSEPARLGVLLSGRGSNFRALHEAIGRGEVPARIVLVASNVADAPGLERARQLGLPAVAIPHATAASRAAHDEEVLAACDAAGVEWICLAGYMRLLSARFVERYALRILNIHPSLLPAFPGLHAQRQALEHGARITGCTVHFADAQLDAGPIVLQRAVPVLDGDTEDTLSARILEQEHQAYPEALRRLLTQRWSVVGRRVIFLPA
jgi:phosphoribosylglycinamide formyltransferase-1